MITANMTAEQRAFFTDFMEEIQRLTAKHKTITNMEFVAIMSRCVSMSVAASPEDERPALRQLAYDNINSGVMNPQRLS